MISLFWVMMSPLLVVLPLYTMSNRIKVLLTEILIGFQLLHFSYAIFLIIHVHDHGPIIENMGGFAPPVGIQLVANYESVIFIALTSFLFLVSLIFGLNRKYINRRFLIFFMTLETLLIGIFTSNDLFNLFIIIEVSTIVISILIMYKKGHRFTYDAILFILANLFVMTFYLFGLGFIYKIFGTMDLGILKQSMPYIQNKSQLIIPFSFIMLAISLKMAMFPLYFWLPKAYATPSAPSIVSVILAGVFTKGSIFLFIRVTDVFSYHFNVNDFFMIVGIITAISGFMIAYIQTEFKRILAYHSISQLGLITVGISFGTELGFYGGFSHIINHGLFKPLLFLTASVIVHGYKEKHVSKISGLFKTSKILSVLTLVGILSITGFPLFNGYFSKSLIYSQATNRYIDFFLRVIQFGTMLSFTKYSSIFFGKKNEEFIHPTKIQYFAISLLALLCLVFGLTQYWLVNLIYDETLTYKTIKLLSATVEYFAYLGLALIVHKYLYPRIQNLAAFLRRYEFSFNSIATNTVLYGIVFISYLIITL
jgi:multicomponent Na+:H+ antiporter subunit D